MASFPDVLKTTRQTVNGSPSLQVLRDAFTALAACCPKKPRDLEHLVNGVVCLLDFYEEPIELDVVQAQLNVELEAIDQLLLGDAVDAEWADPDAVEDAMFDHLALNEFYETQIDKLDVIDDLITRANFPTEEIRRIVHTLKGDAGTIGATQLEQAYHNLEERIAGDLPSEDVAELLSLTSTWARDAAALAVTGLPPTTSEPAWPQIEEEDDLDAPPIEPFHLTTAFETTSSDPEMVAMFGDFYAESMEFLVTADEALIAMESSSPDPGKIDALFRTFHTIKGLAGFLEFRAIAELAHATEARLDLARQDILAFTPTMADLMLQSTAMMQDLIELRRSIFEGVPGVKVPESLFPLIEALNRPETIPIGRARVVTKPTNEASAAPSGGPRLEIVRETIKVDLARVDKLVETIGELVIMEAMVTQSIHRGPSISQVSRHQLSQLSKVVRDLQRQGLALRMVPLRGVFGKMGRLVRDLAKRSYKEVQLLLEGQDAEMDRSLAERLSDPLVHMVRNAIDHGIESPDERERAGKPRQGTLTLSAYHEGGSIVIELSDDGKGLDRERILSKAMERGLIHDPAALSDREVLELIFHPGFSTAATVTEISGRGVGMDVVKSTIEDLRGRIAITSEPGKGTTFRFLLPLTLAIIDGMLVSCGDDRYVLPTLTIEESIQLRPDQLHRFASQGMMIDVRGETIPLINLSEMLNIDSASRYDPLKGLVMLVDGVNGRFGLLVDDVIGQQQVVIKQLSESINGNRLFSGAAILSDGQVGLILNTTSMGPMRQTTHGASYAS